MALDAEEFDLDGYLIGPDEEVAVTNLQLGPVTPRVQDSDSPTRATRLFGRDIGVPGTWEFTLLLNTVDGESTGPAWGRLKAAWEPEDVWSTPGALQVLRYGAGGRTRRVYGRGRDLSIDPNGYANGGLEGTGKFVLDDLHTYDDEARTVVVTSVATSSGGVVFPVTFPITTLGSGTRDGVIPDVGGEASTPYTVTIHGPIANPVVKVGGQTLKLGLTLAYDRSAVIDTRAMTVTRDDGANLSGTLARTTYLDECRLAPGAAEVLFSGTDATGTASCTITWHPAYNGF